MLDPLFNLPHGSAGLDRCRAGHAANPAPGRLLGVAEMRIRFGELLPLHAAIITVRLPAHREFSWSEEWAAEQVPDEGTLQDKPLQIKEEASLTEHDALQDTPQDTESVERLVGAAEREATRTELQAALKLSERRNFIDKYLKPALEAGLIEITLPDKPTSRHQRYRRTQAGEALARRLGESGK